MLKNRLGLRLQADLEQFEAVSVAQRSEEPLPSGRFTPSHYRAIHRHLFADVYPWAGRYRTVRVSKGGSSFCYPENIAAEVNGLFQHRGRALLRTGRSADAVSTDLAAFLAYMNAIHPFREGNGRAQVAFAALVASRAGHPLDLSQLEPERFLSAMIRSFFGDEQLLRDQLRGLMP